MQVCFGNIEISKHSFRNIPVESRVSGYDALVSDFSSQLPDNTHIKISNPGNVCGDNDFNDHAVISVANPDAGKSVFEVFSKSRWGISTIPLETKRHFLKRVTASAKKKRALLDDPKYVATHFVIKA